MKTTNDFFIPDNEVKLPEELDYSCVDEYIRSAEAFSRSTYQSVYIIDYFKQNFLYVSPNPMFLCGLSPEQMRELMVNTIQNELASAGQMISSSDLEQIMAQIRPSGKLQLTIDPTAEPETKIPAASIRVNVATMNVSIHISGGKVLGQEQITTPAGTFDCIKISYIMKTNMAADSLKLYYTAWYAPGIGMVKEQGCDKKGKIM